MKSRDQWEALDVAKLEAEIRERLALFEQMVGPLYRDVLYDELYDLRVLLAARQRVARTTLDEYQTETQRTAPMTISDRERLAVFGLGLGGESGEVQDLIKKHLGHGHDLDKEKVKKELGDVLWYVAAIAGALGLKLSDVANANIEKLRKRYPDGFDPKRSQLREIETLEGTVNPGPTSVVFTGVVQTTEFEP